MARTKQQTRKLVSNMKSFMIYLREHNLIVSTKLSFTDTNVMMRALASEYANHKKIPKQFEDELGRLLICKITKKTIFVRQK